MDVFFLPLKGNTLLPVSRVSLPARCVAAHKGLLWEQSRLQQYDAESIKKITSDGVILLYVAAL